MKINKYNITFIVAFVLLFSSCQKNLLDTAPYGQIGSGNMWTSENLCDKGVLGIYSSLRSNYVALPQAETNMERYAVSGDWRDGTDGLTSGTSSTGDGVFSGYWQQHYEGISRANDAIENLSAAEFLPEAKKARLIAESKILRAFFYYKLNIMFKGVPLYDKVEDVQVYRERPRSTEAQVWEFILKDLADAIAETNLPDKYESGNSNFGHVTKSTAHAIRGKVYMWMKDYAKAESDFRMVGTMGHKLFEGAGTNSYKMLFKEANEQSDEMIFSVQNYALSGYGADWGRSMGNRISVRSGGWNTIMVNTDFVNTYEKSDGSKFSWKEEIPTWDDANPAKNMVYFLRDGLTAGEITTMTSRGADMSQYLPVGNEARILAIYANRDPRLAMTIITPYSTVVGSCMSVDYTYTLRWPYRGSDAAEPFDVRTGTNARFHYLWRKFVPEANAEYSDRLFIAIDFPIIRYADVLISLAEALNEQGKTAEAVAEINKVRERAGAALLNSNTPTTVSGQADMRTRIINERRWELAGEGGNSFYDEIRLKTWDKSTKFVGSGSVVGGHKHIWGQPQYSHTWGGDQFYIWPIPRIERERNSSLEQNSPWVD